jgi:hypothetical protein
MLFENREMRGIYGSKRDEVMVWWRKQHTTELLDLNSSPSKLELLSGGE